MFNNLTFTSILLIVIGFLLLAYGGWYFYRFRDYTWAAGMISLGIGNGLFGVTNGFTDLSPKGRIFIKVGVTALIVGVLVTGYVLSRRI